MIIEIILGILVLVLGYTTFNLFKKLEKMEDIQTAYENWIADIVSRVDSASAQLKELDSRGSFKSDDEVGFFFDYLKDMQKNIADISDRFEEPTGDK